jgi:hypothetical protein
VRTVCTLAGWLAWFAGHAIAADNRHAVWADALAAMPLPAPAPLLNRDNAVCAILESFRSNDVVKAIVVLPGVADDFYLIHRDRPKLNLRAENVLTAIRALTNTTALRATFRDPLLLLHTADDDLEPRVVLDPPRPGSDLDPLQSAHHFWRVHFCDVSWDAAQPFLQSGLGRQVRPAVGSAESAHFERPSLAGWHLTDAEALRAFCLATKTVVSVSSGQITFSLSKGR